MSNKPLALASQPARLENTPLIVLLLLIFDSLHFVLARMLLPYLPPTTSAMYVLAIGTVQVAVFLTIWDEIRWAVLRRHIWFFLAIGFLVATSNALNYTSVAFIDPGTASLLSKMSILFGVGLGLIWLRERFTRWQLMGAVIAIAGVFIISFQPGDYLRLGSLLVLISTFAYALHAALVKRYSANIGLADFFLFRLICTTGFLFLFGIGQGVLVWPGRQAWLLLILAGTLDITISRGLYYLALRRLNLSLHTIILTLSPVAAIGWTMFLFDVWPTPRQLVGGAAVLAGVLLTVGRIKLPKIRRLSQL